MVLGAVVMPRNPAILFVAIEYIVNSLPNLFIPCQPSNGCITVAKNPFNRVPTRKTLKHDIGVSNIMKKSCSSGNIDKYSTLLD